ncbi:hypothetical protein HDV04_001790 [Boothiomyces sp. JEL0838]|nr:hypothetical protein HDV04_001790 [Boothiomyces sp. JEL0838]
MLISILFQFASADVFNIPGVFQVSGAPSTNGQTCFTVHSAEGGWAAIGVGSTAMSGSDIYLGWKNQGTVMVGNFKGTGHNQPSPNSVQNAQQVTLMETAPSWSKLSFSFCRPTTIASNGKSITATQNYIYASSPDQPSGSSVNTLSYSQHASNYGNFNANFAASSNTTTTGSVSASILRVGDDFTYQQVVALHGIMMFIAWMIAPFLGIFCARYLKDVLGHNWYRLHVFFMAFACGLVTLLSFALIFLYIQPPHFNEKHKIIGLIILLCLLFQIMLGYISNARWHPGRKTIPWWDKAHWWFGRGLFLLAIVNVYLGIDLYGDNYGSSSFGLYSFIVVLVLGVIMMIVGQFTYGQVHHVADK